VLVLFKQWQPFFFSARSLTGLEKKIGVALACAKIISDSAAVSLDNMTSMSAVKRPSVSVDEVKHVLEAGRYFLFAYPAIQGEANFTVADRNDIIVGNLIDRRRRLTPEDRCKLTNIRLKLSRVGLAQSFNVHYFGRISKGKSKFLGDCVQPYQRHFS